MLGSISFRGLRDANVCGPIGDQTTYTLGPTRFFNTGREPTLLTDEWLSENSLIDKLGPFSWATFRKSTMAKRRASLAAAGLADPELAQL
jgi:hypothetical protein